VAVAVQPVVRLTVVALVAEVLMVLALVVQEIHPPHLQAKAIMAVLVAPLAVAAAVVPAQ
jgi:hypothetical protein